MSESRIYSLEKFYSGKVRDLYSIDDSRILMVASDRISTFDVILNQLIPNKGIYLTQISSYWFNKLQHIIPNHIISYNLGDFLTQEEISYAQYRSIVVKKVKALPIEIIVRGYLFGSAYDEYKNTGQVCGINLPQGLRKAQALPYPIFTPSTKAKIGMHDENITLEKCKHMIGVDLTHQVKDVAIRLYNFACSIASECNVIIADTKFEFGIDENGSIILIDEVLTPDSSRFWDMKNYHNEESPSSFDKQFLRDYLVKNLKWNKVPPIPELPKDIIEITRQRYLEVINRFGISLKQKIC